jgi:hypothetical protein
MTLALLDRVLALDVGVLLADSLYAVTAAAKCAHCLASIWSCSASSAVLISKYRSSPAMQKACQ